MLEHLIKARHLARATFEKFEGVLSDGAVGSAGAPSQRAAFVPDDVEEVCLRPKVGDFVVVDHGDKITLTRVRAVKHGNMVTESAHVTGEPWWNFGTRTLYAKPRYASCAQWSNFVRALSHRNSSSALLFVNLTSREG